MPIDTYRHASPPLVSCIPSVLQSWHLVLLRINHFERILPRIRKVAPLSWNAWTPSQIESMNPIPNDRPINPWPISSQRAKFDRNEQAVRNHERSTNRLVQVLGAFRVWRSFWSIRRVSSLGSFQQCPSSVDFPGPPAHARKLHCRWHLCWNRLHNQLG